MKIQLLKTIEEVRAWKKNAGNVSLVPTMGNLHAGHLSLVERASSLPDPVIVSIFINPLQFSEGEDLSSYPRTISNDIEQLEKAGVSAVFLPEEKTLYPQGSQSYRIKLSEIAGQLCGQFRPGHFEGVATVVCKLFNIVEPATACFGEKDFQQLHIIKSMVRELNFNISIISGPIVRDDSGLALSSRNTYLSDQEKAGASCLYKALNKIASARCNCISEYEDSIKGEIETISQLGWEADYIEIRDAETLQPPTEDNSALVVLGAMRKKGIRLIDNIQFSRLSSCPGGRQQATAS